MKVVNMAVEAKRKEGCKYTKDKENRYIKTSRSQAYQHISIN